MPGRDDPDEASEGRGEGTGDDPADMGRDADELSIPKAVGGSNKLSYAGANLRPFQARKERNQLVRGTGMERCVSRAGFLMVSGAADRC